MIPITSGMEHIMEGRGSVLAMDKIVMLQNDRNMYAVTATHMLPNLRVMPIAFGNKPYVLPGLKLIKKKKKNKVKEEKTKDTV